MKLKKKEHRQIADKWFGRLQKLIKQLKSIENPYPEDIFTPLSNEEIQKYTQLLTEHGFSNYRIHAHWLRYGFEVCKIKIEKILEDWRR